MFNVCPQYEQLQCYTLDQCVLSRGPQWEQVQCYTLDQCVLSRGLQWEQLQCYTLDQCVLSRGPQWEQLQCYTLDQYVHCVSAVGAVVTILYTRSVYGCLWVCRSPRAIPYIQYRSIHSPLYLPIDVNQTSQASQMKDYVV